MAEHKDQPDGKSDEKTMQYRGPDHPFLHPISSERTPPLPQAFIFYIKTKSPHINRIMNLEFLSRVSPIFKYLIEEYVPGLYITGINGLNLMLVDKISRLDLTSNFPVAHRVHNLPQVRVSCAEPLHAPQHVPDSADRDLHREQPDRGARNHPVEKSPKRFYLRNQR